MIALAQEIETYNRLLPDLLCQIGKFVVIKRTELVGTYDSYTDALNAGYRRFKLDTFLVKPIPPELETFSRDLYPSPPAATIDMPALGMKQSH